MHQPKSQIAHRIAIYEASDPHDPNDIQDLRTEKEGKRVIGWAAIGASALAALVLVTPQGRSEAKNLLHPLSANGSNPSRAELAKDHAHILRLAADPGHPGFDEVTFKYGPDETGDSAIAAIVAPAEDAGAVHYDLQTYPDIGDVVHQGDTATFDINDSSGNIVPNPN